MAYAQGLGRSSILLISLFLIIDYGINPSTYFRLAGRIAMTTTCSLTYSEDPAQDNSEIVRAAGRYTPIAMLIVAIPSYMVQVSHLKFYARALFTISMAILATTLLTFVVTKP